MLGPQGTGHAQIFAKGDSPLAVSGAEISRFQPEWHENISRPRVDHEIRVSDFMSTASEVKLMDGGEVLYVGLCAPTGFITNHIDVPTYAAVDRSLQALQQFAEHVFGPVDQLSSRHPRSK